jgi:hypothetical protein
LTGFDATMRPMLDYVEDFAELGEIFTVAET